MSGKINNLTYFIMASLWIIIIALVLSIILATSVLLNGLVIKCLCLWFLSPFGLPELSIMHATGLGVISRYLIWQNTRVSSYKDQRSDKQFIVQECIMTIVYPLLVLLLGFIIKTIGI